MTLRLRRFAMAACTILWCGMPAIAASLDDTVRRAIASYPAIPEAAAARRAVEAELDGANAAFLPRVDLDGSIGPHVVDRPGSLSKEVNREARLARQVGVVARHTLFDGWNRENEVYRQGMRTNSAAFRVLERASLVALEAVEAHIDIVRHSRVLALSNENIEAYRGILSDIQLRFSGGGAGAGEVEQATERLASAQAVRSEVLRSLGAAEAKYRKLTARDPHRLAAPRAPRLMPKSRQAALAIAKTNHPALVAAGFDVRGAEAEIEQAKARVLPTIGLEGRASVGQDLGGVSNWNNEAQGRMTMSWLLYDGGVTAARKRQTIERRTEQELRRDRIVREIGEAVDVAWSDITATLERAGALSRQESAARRVVQVYRDEFGGGRRSLIDVLDAQGALFNTRVANVGASAVVLFARYKVVASAGRILEEFRVAAPQEAVPLPSGAIGDIRRLGPVLEPIRSSKP